MTGSSQTVLQVEPVGMEIALRTLAARAEQVLSSTSPIDRRIVRVEVQVADMDPLTWLADRDVYPRLFWSARGEDDAVAAIGSAEQFTGSQALSFVQPRLQIVPGDQDRIRYYGGLRFSNETRQEGRWIPFDHAWFVLPRLELRTHRGEAWLGCNLVLPADHRRKEEIFQLISGAGSVGGPLTESLPQPLRRDDWPEEHRWKDAVDEVLRLIRTTSMEKVVLARRASFQFDGDVPPLRLLQLLRDATPGCFHFCIQPEEGPAFIGASPERLFRRDGRDVESEAVAGTRPRGGSRRDDARLRSELLLSEKDRREHAFVEQYIREQLDPLCSQLTVDSNPSEMTLARGRHLYSATRGTIRQNVTDADLLKALHPTPAVGGYPSADAQKAIARLEQMDRGWYAGPIGWIGKNAAEFAVGIRSGLVSGAVIDLFSGAGIVEGSEPDAEWREIEHKIGDFINVLGIEHRNGSL